MSQWQVLRHGGRSSDTWKVKLATADEQKAREKYDKLYRDFRQGGLRLVDPAGKVVEGHSAPRLRTRW